ncbi:MAG: glycosyltransferase family 39 protein [Clostridia bacterium]|nr:glycosyltransferase family 39 protein [Clostridia bacterium]
MNRKRNRLYDDRPSAGHRPDEGLERQFGAILFCFALLLRLTVAGGYLNAYDTEWNLMWGMELGDGFFSAYTHVTSLDYPPLYLYPLYLVGRLMRLTEFQGYAPFRMLAIKCFPCLADSLTCAVLYRLGGRRNASAGMMAAALWAVNPATVFNCAFWGQTDCVLICLAALLFEALAQKRVTLSGVLFAAMCATKLQGLYLTPVVGMEIWYICFGTLRDGHFLQHMRSGRIWSDRRWQRGAKKFLRFAGAVGGTFAVIYLPFMIGGAIASSDRAAGFFQPLTVYADGVDKYPYITMNADNIYMLLGLNGVSDDIRFLPGVSVSLLGKFFLLAAVAAVPAVYLRGKRHSHWLAAYMLTECIFMLTCRQHERYQIITLLFLMGGFLQLADRRLLTLFSLQSAVIFFNQARVLGSVLERTGWWEGYRTGRRATNQSMIPAQQAVISNGAWWVRHHYDFAVWNAFFNVCLMAVSLTLVLRYLFNRNGRIMQRNFLQWIFPRDDRERYTKRRSAK